MTDKINKITATVTIIAMLCVTLVFCLDMYKHNVLPMKEYRKAHQENVQIKLDSMYWSGYESSDEYALHIATTIFSNIVYDIELYQFNQDSIHIEDIKHILDEHFTSQYPIDMQWETTVSGY